MWKNEEISNLKKTSDKIDKIIGTRTKSQKEILKELLLYLKLEDKDLHPKVLSDHLRRLVDKRKIAYIGTKYGKVYPKMLLRKVYRRKWPENTQRVYLKTPRSGKLYRRMIRRFGRSNKDLIIEITRYYQAIEVKCKFQEIYMTKIMKKDIKRYYKSKNSIVKIDSNDSNFLEFIKIIKFTPIMHWCTYKGGGNISDLTMPLFSNLRDLFVRIHNLEVLNPPNKFDSFRILKN